MTSSTPQAVEIYELYPRKVKKPLALKAIMRAIQRDGYEKVRDGTRAYAERAKDHDMAFLPYPASYFNGEMYNDDLDALLPRSKINGHKNGKASLSDLRAILKAKEEIRNELRFKYRTESATGHQWSDNKKREEAQKLSNEIKHLNAQIAGFV